MLKNKRIKETSMKLQNLLNLFSAESKKGVFVGRRKTHDIAITYRMPAGFVGDVNRTHPASIEPCLIDATNPPTLYGQAVVADDTSTNGVRIPATGDAATAIYGVTVRPFPFQQQATTNYGAATIGGEIPPSSGAIDILRSGYIMVVAQGVAPTYKGAPVKVCTVAGTGYVAGGFSADTVSGTFVSLDSKSSWNGPADANGIAELAFNI